MKTKFLAMTKDVNYASSKTSATVATALNPYNLAEGAVGVYGVADTATNSNKLVLIRDADAGSAAAGVELSTTFNGEEVFFAVGTADGYIKSDPFQLRNLKGTSKAYVAGTKKVQDIGITANNATGSANFPSTINRGDEAFIKVVNLADYSELDRTGKTYSGYASKDSDNIYNILVDLVTNVYADSERNIDVDINTNLTGSAVGGTNVTVTNGSTAVTTTGTDHLLDVGDYVDINGDTYKVTADGGANAFTLDRKYTGATETIVVANVIDLGGTDPTDAGLVITDKEVGNPVAVSAGELLQSATKITSTDYVAPVGTGSQIRNAENRAVTRFGNLSDINDRRVPLKELLTDTSLNYDQYVITALNSRVTSDPHTSNGNSQVYTEAVLAFSQGLGDTGGENQSDFEDVMEDLATNYNFTTIPSIVS